MTVFCTSSVLSCALIANAASSCPTDLDQDGSTGFTDLVSLLGSWDTPEGDIDGDGNTGFPDLTALLSAFGPCAGPTFEEPFHLPSLRDPSTLDVEIVEDWHVDTIDGTTRQKVINIHVDDWWPGVEIRVPVRMIVPLNASAQGFTITGAGLDDFEGDHPISSDKQVALDAGAGVVITKIKSVNSYPELPSENMMRQRFGATLDWRYSEYFLWGSIMMRSITAAFAEEEIQAGPVVAHGNSKNGMTPLISSIQDDRITGVYSVVAGTAYTPIRALDPLALAEVTAANEDFEQARADDLPEGDQEWEYYYKVSTQNSSLPPLKWAGPSKTCVMRWIALLMTSTSVKIGKRCKPEVSSTSACLVPTTGWPTTCPPQAKCCPTCAPTSSPTPATAAGHLDSPDEAQAKSAFFAQIFAGGDEGLEVPTMITNQDGNTLEVTVTFPEGGEPEDSRIFWMYDRGPDGSNWYLYELFPQDNWSTMTGNGSTWSASIELEPGHSTIDIITTHTKTVDERLVPISRSHTPGCRFNNGKAFGLNPSWTAPPTSPEIQWIHHH